MTAAQARRIICDCVCAKRLFQIEHAHQYDSNHQLNCHQSVALVPQLLPSVTDPHTSAGTSILGSPCRAQLQPISLPGTNPKRRLCPLTPSSKPLPGGQLRSSIFGARRRRECAPAAAARQKSRGVALRRSCATPILASHPTDLEPAPLFLGGLGRILLLLCRSAALGQAALGWLVMFQEHQRSHPQV